MSQNFRKTTDSSGLIFSACKKYLQTKPRFRGSDDFSKCSSFVELFTITSRKKKKHSAFKTAEDYGANLAEPEVAVTSHSSDRKLFDKCASSGK